MKYAYKITGGKPVYGEIKCYGAKNFATKAIVAALLSNDSSTLQNVPPIGDVNITLELIKSIGVDYRQSIENSILDISPLTIKNYEVPLPDSGSNRIPILLLGPLLHRFGKAKIPVLGGCKIGERKVDFHIKAIELFGGTVEETDYGYEAFAEKGLVGAHIDLDYPSVGATETCLFLSVLAKGSTIINNVAMEPEIIELISLLRSMGAIIFTYPERKIRIEGVKKLHGTNYSILGDRIEGASWACLACATDGEIIVDGLSINTLGNFISYFQQVGGGYQLLENNKIRFFRKEPLKPAMIETDVFPGFSTDWQQPFAILLTQADGVSIIHETVYEKRFGYLEALNKLGAKTQLSSYCLGYPCRFQNKNFNHSAIITGKTPLISSGDLEVPDLRAGLAYVIVASIAKGTTILTGIENIERGYGNVAERLSGMIEIERISL
ncbi:MAG: UDP-N-acetylglucosamine 1-carboxyvinyltransferase [Bacteroidales bacterium]|jgi:UDP-N-acetylglucosamine 1-carboxyvinyltransferase|nr:UDP-N-acetylglucosamine 1-carboxyvinyltransferase [Bacteroidales bacterium]